MRNPGGYAQIISPVRSQVMFNRLDGLRCEEVGEGLTEYDTFTCCHCNSGVHVQAGDRSADLYFCRNCMARICSPCADFPCIPFKKKLEEAEAKDRLWRATMAG